MNTFLIGNDHARTARCLDPGRLNRQLTECIQIAKCLRAYEIVKAPNGKIPFGVQFPPVIKLWISDSGKILIPELFDYYRTLHIEWKCTVSKNRTNHGSFRTFNWNAVGAFNRKPLTVEWDDSVYESHKAKLLSKDASFYTAVFQREAIEIPSSFDVEYTWESPVIL